MRMYFCKSLYLTIQIECYEFCIGLFLQIEGNNLLKGNVSIYLTFLIISSKTSIITPEEIGTTKHLSNSGENNTYKSLLKKSSYALSSMKFALLPVLALQRYIHFLMWQAKVTILSQSHISKPWQNFHIDNSYGIQKM